MEQEGQRATHLLSAMPWTLQKSCLQEQEQEDNCSRPLPLPPGP